jgi:adenylate cyclase
MVTVLQSDIRGFTRLSDEIGPQRLSDLLNAYFPPLLEAIFAFGGSVERFVGDAIFAVFGSPEADGEQQEHAVCAALAMQQTMAEVSAFRVKHRQPICGIGIGIDCGEAMHGFLGNAESIEFTVIGDAANYASRYCTGASAGEILISSNVYSHVWKQVDSETRMIATKHEGEIEAHVVKGRRSRATSGGDQKT